jgi:hypothetical protein
MARAAELEQPLLPNPQLANSVCDKLAVRFAKCILRARFNEVFHETQCVDEVARRVALPLLHLGVLMVAMIVSTAGALCHLYGMSTSLAAICTVIEFQAYTPQTSPGWERDLTIKTRSDWNKERIEGIIDAVQNQDVHYTYLFMVVADSKGKGFMIETSPPWDTDVNHLEFPLFLSLVEENEIQVSHMIWDNIIVQVMNPLWLVLSFASLWGWVHLPVLGPIGHILQLGSASLVDSSAALALISPPQVHLSMSEKQLESFNKCKGNDQGLQCLIWLLAFQTVIGLLLLPAAGAVGKRFSHVMKLSSAFTAIEVSLASENQSCNICPICLDSLKASGSNPEDPGTLWTLPCSHTYHKDCILPWLTHGRDAVGTCPTCRAGQDTNIDH